MRFDELDLEDEILDGLWDMHFEEMTPVQEHTIPVILEGHDIIGCAQTGTGKTAAYTLPLLNRLLLEGNPDNVVKALIIVPTRELAQQIDQQFQGFSYYLPVSTTVVYGGGDGKGWDVQKRGMLMGSDVVIATPGRMISHLQNSGIDLSKVSYLILDEADRMLDMGFSEDILKIISYTPKERQTLLFSATLPPKIRELAKTILRDPVEVNIAISKPNEAIDQSAYVCYETQKLNLVKELFKEPFDSKALIFSSSKQKVKELAHTLKRMHLDVAPMHSDLDQPKREEVMLNYKNGKVKILVATDIVARGIDIEDITLVINYDVPHDPEDYIHRIGRTARAAATGAAITFVNEEEQSKFYQIEKFIEREVRKRELPEGMEGPAYNPSDGRRSGGKGRKGRGGKSRSRRGRGDKPRTAGEPSSVAAPTTDTIPADNNHGEGRGEGNRGTRDRRRRHRGGRHHRKNTTNHPVSDDAKHDS
ncbi:MAG: DEAD/DEAH box helicase [Alistipes sp.]|nr:DEAD/DEAH box helicase [Alistipes sp.]